MLDSFGNAKTLMSPYASRHACYLELHFSEAGRVIAAKILAFGLDKNLLIRLTHEERTYHIFYQFIAGATTAERDNLNIEDPSRQTTLYLFHQDVTAFLLVPLVRMAARSSVMAMESSLRASSRNT
jgi:myosin heavy subunit